MPKKIYVVEGEGEAAKIVGLRFLFEDGSEQVFDAGKVNEATAFRAMYHGFSQKIGDSYAGANKAENPLAYAKQAVKETIAQLYANEWRATAEGGPKAPTDLAVAMARVSGKTAETCQAFVDSLDDEGKKAWKAKGKIKAALAQIAAEKAAAKAKKLADAAAAAGGENAEDEDEDLEIPETEGAEGQEG